MFIRFGLVKFQNYLSQGYYNSGVTGGVGKIIKKTYQVQEIAKAKQKINLAKIL